MPNVFLKNRRFGCITLFQCEENRCNGCAWISHLITNEIKKYQDIFSHLFVYECLNLFWQESTCICTFSSSRHGLCHFFWQCGALEAFQRFVYVPCLQRSASKYLGWSKPCSRFVKVSETVFSWHFAPCSRVFAANCQESDKTKKKPSGTQASVYDDWELKCREKKLHNQDVFIYM